LGAGLRISVKVLSLFGILYFPSTPTNKNRMTALPIRRACRFFNNAEEDQNEES